MPHDHDQHDHDHDEEHFHGPVEDEDTELDREQAVRKRMALAQIRQYPDPVLRLRANEIESFDRDLAQLVERMKTLMRDARGIGLAANQVGVLRRLFIFDLDDETPVALVNPTITARGGEPESSEEGCLSLQGVLVPVERSTEVTIEGKDETGQAVRYELEGLPARCVQHELDHLDGVLILERTTSEGRRAALKALRPQPILQSAE